MSIRLSLCVSLCVPALSLVLSLVVKMRWAAGSSVRVCIWVIRSPETLRLRLRSPSWFRRVPASFCVALRFFGFVFAINLRMSVGPFPAFVCIVNGNSV